MRVLTLIENTTTNKKLYTEHGLSFYIELNGKKILMDAGASDRFARNAVKMQIDLHTLDAAFVSHNHADHIGGLEALFKLCPDIKVFARRDVAGDYYYRFGAFNFAICWNKNYLNRRSGNFILFNNFQEISDGLFAMACEIHDGEFGTRDKRLYKKENGRYVPDDFKHEIFAVAFPHKEREKGCVVLSSCSHSGIVNILRTVRNTWLNSPILGVIGGFHLKSAANDNAYLDKTAEQLSQLSTGCVYTCHCTGDKAYARLKERMGDQLQYLGTGEELVF